MKGLKNVFLTNDTAIYPQIQQFIHKKDESQYTKALEKNLDISPQSYTQIDHRVFYGKER